LKNHLKFLQLLQQVQSLHRYLHDTLKLPPRCGILIMADAKHSAAWLVVDIATLFGAYLSLPLNVGDSASSVGQVIAMHQVPRDFWQSACSLVPHPARSAAV
jgi:hypothetical protein